MKHRLIYILFTRLARRGYNVAKWLDDPILLEKAIDRVTALKMATTQASEHVLSEDILGTLEPGKYADSAVLDKDFFTILVGEIRELQVVMTELNGQIVYEHQSEQ